MEIYRALRGFPRTREVFLSSPGTSAAPKDLRCRHRTSPPAEEILTSGGTTPNICICKGQPEHPLMRGPRDIVVRQVDCLVQEEHGRDCAADGGRGG